MYLKRDIIFQIPMIDSQESVASPCVRQCCLNEQDICMGCFRSLAEIVAWSQVDHHQRREFCLNAHRRREQLDKA